MSNIRPSPIFVADAKGLDFLNSIATPVDTPVEWLGSGDDLLAWLEEADLVPPDVLKILKTSALPGELDAVAAQARSLREWFRGFVQKHKGKTLRASALRQLDPLNRVLERDEVFGQVAPRDQEFRDRARLPSNVGRAAPLAFTGKPASADRARIGGCDLQ